MTYCVRIGIAVMWSTGLEKKPCTWPAWRSIVTTPVDARRLEHARPRGGPRSARAAPTSCPGASSRTTGVTAMMRCAEACLAACDHQQQLHQRVVRRHALALGAADRLDDEQVGAADRLRVAAVHLAVGEGLEPDVGELDARACSAIFARPARGSRGPRSPSAASRSSASDARDERHGAVSRLEGLAHSLRVLLHAVRVTLDVLLLRPRDAEGALGMSSVITDPAPVYAPSPTSTGATSEVWMPVFTLFPSFVRCFLRPS